MASVSSLSVDQNRALYGAIELLETLRNEGKHDTESLALAIECLTYVMLLTSYSLTTLYAMEGGGLAKLFGWYDMIEVHLI
jgi:hypothetical protein